jgi:ankyrin repeat protein
VVRALLEANPASVASRCEGSPPLHMAACLAALPRRADFAVEATKLLLSHGASIRERCCSEPAYDWLLSWFTHLAERGLQSRSLRSVHVCGSRDDQGRTPLHWAAISGSTALTRTLIVGESDRLAAAAAALELAGEAVAEAPADEPLADQTPLAMLQAGSAHVLQIVFVLS